MRVAPVLHIRYPPHLLYTRRLMGLSDANDDMEDLPEEVIRERYMKYSTIPRGDNMHLERVYSFTPNLDEAIAQAIAIADSLSLENYPDYDRVREVLSSIPIGDGKYFTYIAQGGYGEEIWILVPSK